MSVKNFVIKNGATIGNVIIDAASSNISNANVITANLFSGNGNSLSSIQGGNVVGQVGNAAIAGSVYTAAQGNITSVGTLTSLNVNAVVNATGFTSNVSTGTAPLTVSSTTRVTNLNVDYANVSDFGVVTNQTTGTFYPVFVNGSTTANYAQGSNANLSFNAATGALSATLLTGTLTTASQPNVTSVGTLSNLVVSGNIQSNANVITDSILGLTGAITITSAGANTNINLKPNGTGNIDANSTFITNVKDPINDQDAATKGYVDATAQGLDPKASVVYATTTALPAYTYNNGTAGVGATLTGDVNGILSIDSGALSVGIRVLIKNEGAGNASPYNGIYVVTNTGSAGSPYVLTRSADFNVGVEMPGAFIFVEMGSVNDNTGWVCTSNNPITVGTTDITFTQFSGAGTYTAGTGLTLTGSQFSISNTAVTAASYGGSDSVASFTVNQQGQLTAASNVSITANAANLTGTTLNASVITSSLTSVGTLGTLTVTSTITAGDVYANSGTIGASNLTGTLTTASQPNVTSVGTLSNLAATGNVNLTGASNVSLGAIGNVKVTGGSNTQVIQTDGNGNLSFVTISTSSLTNGTSNLQVLASSNITMSVAGNANVVVVSGTGANITGTANISGNLSAGNIDAGNLLNANYVTGTLTTNAQPNITSVGTLTSLSVTGNITNGNITGGNLVSANYFTGTLTTNAQPNITSIGTLSNLSVTGNVSANNVTANYVAFNGGAVSNRSNVGVTTSATVIDEFSTATFRTAKYVISAASANGYQSIETLLVQDGANAYITIYGSICTNNAADLIDITANINGVSGNVTVYATANSTVSSTANVNVVVQYILT